MTEPILDRGWQGQEQLNNDLNKPQETSGRNPSGLRKVIRKASGIPILKHAFRPALALATVLGTAAAVDHVSNTDIVNAFASSLHDVSRWVTSGDMSSQKPFEQQINQIEETKRARESLQSLEISTTTDFRVEDIRVVNGNHTVAVVTLTDGTKAFAEGDIDPATGNLTLTKKAILNFNAYGAFVSATDPKIAGAFGNAGPGQNEGINVFTKDGWLTQQTLNTGGQFIDADITSDNKYILARQSNTIVSDLDYIYKAYDLNTGIPKTITNCAGCVEGSLQAPITPSPNNPNVYITGANSAFPSLGYTRGEVEIGITQTMTTTQFHPEQGYPIGRRLTQFTNAQGEREVWLINDFTADQTGNRIIGILFRNFNDIHDPNKDVRPSLALYPEANGSILRDIVIVGAAADVIADRGFMATGVNINNVSYAHVEVFPLSNPSDLTQRQLIPEDGDWSPVGKQYGDPIRSINVLNQGAEKYLVVDRRTNNGNFFLIRKITNGFTSADPWKKVELTSQSTTGGLNNKIYLPIIIKGY